MRQHFVCHRTNHFNFMRLTNARRRLSSATAERAHQTSATSGPRARHSSALGRPFVFGLNLKAAGSARKPLLDLSRSR